MTDCCAPAYGKAFGARGARRAADRDRRKGLDNDARWIVEVLREGGTGEATVLELGGGVGGLHVELLRSGAATAVNVELSPEWEDEATALLREHGLEKRVERRVGDAVRESAALDAADIVIMHRVLCCYPDAESLIEMAAEHTRRFLAVSFPRERLLVRLVIVGSNLWFRLRRIPFRSYVHPESTIEAAARRNGLRTAADRRGRIWRAIAFERAPSAGG